MYISQSFKQICTFLNHSNICTFLNHSNRYVPEVQEDGRPHQFNNPEVSVEDTEETGIVAIQIYNLKLITGKLHNAFNGYEVSWTPDVGMYI